MAEACKSQATRGYFYYNGFNINSIHYVRNKRSAESSREDTCCILKTPPLWRCFQYRLTNEEDKKLRYEARSIVL